MSATLLAFGLGPHGRVVVDPGPPDAAVLGADLGADLAEGLAAAVDQDDVRALIDLAARHPTTGLPPSVGYFRDVARRVLAAAAASPTGRAVPDLDQSTSLDAAPPMLGHEYLNVDTLAALGARLAAALNGALDRTGQTLEAWLHERSPAWAVVGRVCFHLAENRRDEARPFAFLATYSVGLSAPRRSSRRSAKPNRGARGTPTPGSARRSRRRGVSGTSCPFLVDASCTSGERARHTRSTFPTGPDPSVVLRRSERWRSVRHGRSPRQDAGRSPPRSPSR